jgi:hypothetical protein
MVAKPNIRAWLRRYLLKNPVGLTNAIINTLLSAPVFRGACVNAEQNQAIGGVRP